MAVFPKRSLMGSASLRTPSVLVAGALCLSSSAVHAGPLDDLINKALKAARTATDAASAAVSNVTGTVAPPKPPAPTAAASASPGPAATPPAVRPPPSAAGATAPPLAATTALTPTQGVPISPSDWNYRVTAGPPFTANSGWTIEEAQDYGAYTEHVNPCSSAQIAGGGANELFSKDLVAKIRLERDYPQMLGQFAIINAAAKAAPASADVKAIAPAIRCLALLKQQFPELGKVQFTYFTFKSGKIVNKSGGLKDLLSDGAFDESGQKAFSPSFDSEDLVALGDLEGPAKAPPAPAVARLSTAVTSGKPLPALKKVARELQNSFSIGAYEAVAIKSDGTVEVRSFDFPNAFNQTEGTIGAGRAIPGLRNVVGVRAQATYDTIRIGTVSAARDSDGNWMGWRPNAQAAPIAFENHLATLGMTNLEAPPSREIVNFSGGRTSLWHLLADGSVLMASQRGVLPGTFEANWEKDHKFKGVTKIVATPGPNGSFRALFLKEDGTVWANGRNFYQGWLQVEGTAAEKRLSPMADQRLSPVQLQSLNHVRDIAAYWPSESPGKGVALLDDGSVVWFRIDAGMSDATLTNLAVLRVERLKKARHVAAGAWGVGVVDAEGRVWVWGSNPEVLSQGNRPVPGFRGGAPISATDDEPTMVPGLSDVLDINFSMAYAGALRSDGTVWVWNRQAPVKIFDDVRIAP